MRIGKGSNTLEMRLDGAYIPLLAMCAEFLGGRCTWVNAGRSIDRHKHRPPGKTE